MIDFSNIARLSLGIAWALAAATTAAAGPSKDWAECSNDNSDAQARIAACTSLLDRADGPNDMRALVLSNRGSALTDAGETAKALADFDAALALQPDLAEALNGRCWARAVSGTKLAEALKDCNAAIAIAPNDPDELDSRGFVHLRLKENEKAIEDYTAALAKKSSEASSLYGRGLARARLGQDAAAAKDIEQAKSADSKIADEFAAMGVKQ